MPGLHLLTMGKIKLGSSFLAFHVLLTFVMATGPYEPVLFNITVVRLTELGAILIFLTYIYFIFSDHENLADRVVSIPILITAIIITAIMIWPYDNYYDLDIQDWEHLCLIGCNGEIEETAPSR